MYYLLKNSKNEIVYMVYNKIINYNLYVCKIYDEDDENNTDINGDMILQHVNVKFDNGSNIHNMSMYFTHYPVELGKFDQIYDDVSGIVSNYLDMYEDFLFYLILCEIAAIIAAWTMLLFGHGLVGQAISALLILAVITLPLIIYSFYLAGLVSLASVVDAIIDFLEDIDIVELFGIIGAFIFLLFIALPLGLTAVVIGCAVLTFPLYVIMMLDILDYAFLQSA